MESYLFKCHHPIESPLSFGHPDKLTGPKNLVNYANRRQQTKRTNGSLNPANKKEKTGHWITFPL